MSQTIQKGFTTSPNYGLVIQSIKEKITRFNTEPYSLILALVESCSNHSANIATLDYTMFEWMFFPDKGEKYINRVFSNEEKAIIVGMKIEQFHN